MLNLWRRSCAWWAGTKMRDHWQEEKESWNKQKACWRMRGLEETPGSEPVRGE